MKWSCRVHSHIIQNSEMVLQSLLSLRDGLVLRMRKMRVGFVMMVVVMESLGRTTRMSMCMRPMMLVVWQLTCA